MFAAVERDALIPLPAAPFVLATWVRGKVAPDIHVHVIKTLYSIPWEHIGKTVDARVTDTIVQFFFRGELIKTHIYKARGKQTDECDYPPEKIAFFMRTPQWCLQQVRQVGPACEQVILALMGVNALRRLRQAQGVIRLLDKHDPGRLEAACARALEAGDPTLMTVRGILAAGAEGSLPERPAGDGGAGAFLHGQESFASNVIPLPARGTAAAGAAADAAGPAAGSPGAGS